MAMLPCTGYEADRSMNPRANRVGGEIAPPGPHHRACGFPTSRDSCHSRRMAQGSISAPLAVDQARPFGVIAGTSPTRVAPARQVQPFPSCESIRETFDTGTGLRQPSFGRQRNLRSVGRDSDAPRAGN
jgi:hypothetical protein